MTTKRRPITIQLNPRSDADILANVHRLPDGQRNTGLKDILRAGFNLPVPQANHTNGALVEELELLRRAVQLNAVQLEELRQENVALRQILEQLPGYLTEVLSRFASSVAIAPPEQPIEIEDSPRLDNESLQRRTSKMRKAQW